MVSVLQVVRTTEEDALGLEVAKTTWLKAKRGWHNVRGGVDKILETVLCRPIGRPLLEVSPLRGCVQDHR